jgi:DGQHR domain-containing protein
MPDTIKIKIIEIEQPIGKFYIGKVKAGDLFDICKADVRRIEMKDEIENYIGIQRPLNQQRVNEIKEYVKTLDASFPNSIILSLNSKYLINNTNSDTGELIIERDKNAATIIDGQHRLSGFEVYKPNNFDLIVTIFLDMENEEKALLFSIINTKQTKINPSLASDLLEFSKIDTPSKISHNIAKAMNNDKQSPWFDKIKMLGTKSEIYKEEIITQSAFTAEITKLICKEDDLFTIRDNLKKHSRQKLKELYNYDIDKIIFWDLYTEEKEEVIYKILDNFFRALSKEFPKEWVNKRYILSKTTGYKAFMNLLVNLYNEGKKAGDLSLTYFRDKIRLLKPNLKDLTSDEYESGERGVSRLKKDLKIN